MLIVRSVEDLTTKARIRDAAIERFPRDGFAGTTIRAVAADVGVSPALVLHHFGSKDELRRVCDEHVMRRMHEMKMKAIANREHADASAVGVAYSLAQPLLRYLGWAVAGPNDAAAHIFDAMLDEVTEQLEAAEGLGMVRNVDDRRSLAAVLLAMQLGGLVLHEHLSRALGVDTLTPEGLTITGRLALRVMSGALYEPSMVAEADASLQLLQNEFRHEETDR
jgi:AcrR family transcriptional regulator